MTVLRWTFYLLTCCGCWRPSTWSSSWKKIIYNLHMMWIFFWISSFTLSQFMDVVFNVDNSDEFTDNIYMLLAMMISCCKMSSLLINNKGITLLLHILNKEPCKPMDDEEMRIQGKYDRMIRLYTIRYTTLMQISVLNTFLTPFLKNLKEKKLTLRAWLPFNYTSTTLFCCIYWHQYISVTLGAMLHAASDGLICGFIVHASCQIEILEHRLRKVSHGKEDVLSVCVHHHDCIYRFAAILNYKFKVMIFIQFLVSTLILCFNLYLLAKMKMFSQEFIHAMLYTICVLMQIFCYCWFGHQVKSKSLQVSDTIFGTDWFTLSNNSKKTLLVIMRRSTVPIEFTSMAIISMNLDSFINLLKSSYSAYNLLQQTQEK